MRLRILGCNGGISSGLRTTSLLIDDDILIDAGSGVGDLTLEEMAKIRHVFVTHTHLDHIAFLPLMVDSIFEQIKVPIVIHGLPETIAGLQNHIFNWVIWPDFACLPTPDRPVMTYQVEQPGTTCDMDGRRFELIPVNHIVPTVGYRVESPTGRSFAFSGDTATNDTLWAALNAHAGLDVLLMEAAFGDDHEALSRAARHYCAKTLGQDIGKLRHNPAIYLTHPKPGDEQVILSECRKAIPDRTINTLHNGQVFEL